MAGKRYFEDLVLRWLENAILRFVSANGKKYFLYVPLIGTEEQNYLLLTML